ncbi:MAG TPA: tetratricopeptide repeat protein [Thermoanaerobaculia bacterium]|nr:tetratricopeptide repeat protein [Thermoanaerobaculia bacterium]
MSRSAAERRLRAAAALALLLAGLLPAALAAETTSSAQATGVEMTAPVRRTLKQLEEQWLQWIVKNDRQSSESGANDLLATARQLGITRLPDLSAGAIAKGLQAAEKGDFRRARWALAAAEKLDPGRSDTAFAEAAVSRKERAWGGMISSTFRGYARLFSLPLERYLWLQSLLIWTLTLLLLAGALFIAVQMAAKGGELYQSMIALFGRWLPRPVAVAVTAIVLLWPLALPSGLLWLPLFWSLLLWSYSSASERTVMVALWLLVAVAPLLVTEQRRQVAVMFSPPVQAMESLDQHRLYGGLFTDLGALQTLLPDSPAVKHLLGDVHRSLNQWDVARSLYRQVLEKEPENTSALMNLGAYFFLKGDFGNAIQHFQKVSTVDAENAAAQFNLSQAYSESYLFDESRQALARARQIDDARVVVWVKNLSQQRVVANNGGMIRIPEIRRELLETWRRQEGKDERLALFRRGLPVLVSALLILVAVALHFVRRTEWPEPAGERRSLGPWGRALLPGFRSAEAGEGARSYASLLLPLGLLMLPFFQKIGYRIPWGYDPGNAVSWIVAITGLVLLLGARLRLERRNEV